MFFCPLCTMKLKKNYVSSTYRAGGNSCLPFLFIILMWMEPIIENWNQIGRLIYHAFITGFEPKIGVAESLKSIPCFILRHHLFLSLRFSFWSFFFVELGSHWRVQIAQQNTWNDLGSVCSWCGLPFYNLLLPNVRIDNLIFLPLLANQ